MESFASAHLNNSLIRITYALHGFFSTRTLGLRMTRSESGRVSAQNGANAASSQMSEAGIRRPGIRRATSFDKIKHAFEAE